jgi:hypothetical protein
MSFELRWFVSRNTVKRTTLQMRFKIFGAGNALAPSWTWSDWQDVPFIMEGYDD